MKCLASGLVLALLAAPALARSIGEKTLRNHLEMAQDLSAGKTAGRH
jgi:hypothetical protein